MLTRWLGRCGCYLWRCIAAPSQSGHDTFQTERCKTQPGKCTGSVRSVLARGVARARCLGITRDHGGPQVQKSVKVQRLRCAVGAKLGGTRLEEGWESRGFWGGTGRLHAPPVKLFLPSGKQSTTSTLCRWQCKNTLLERLLLKQIESDQSINQSINQHPPCPESGRLQVDDGEMSLLPRPSAMTAPNQCRRLPRQQRTRTAQACDRRLVCSSPSTSMRVFAHSSQTSSQAAHGTTRHDARLRGMRADHRKTWCGMRTRLCGVGREAGDGLEGSLAPARRQAPPRITRPSSAHLQPQRCNIARHWASAGLPLLLLPVPDRFCHTRTHHSLRHLCNPSRRVHGHGHGHGCRPTHALEPSTRDPPAPVTTTYRCVALRRCSPVLCALCSVLCALCSLLFAVPFLPPKRLS